MGTFRTPLRAEQVGKWEHTLLYPLIYEDDEENVLIAPTDFHTDFASILVLHNVVLFPLYALVAGYGNRAATIHDMLYRSGGAHTPLTPIGALPTEWKGVMSRKRCDAVLYRALRAEGVSAWRARLFWLGVRVGGGSHFAKSD